MYARIYRFLISSVVSLKYYTGKNDLNLPLHFGFVFIWDSYIILFSLIDTTEPSWCFSFGSPGYYWTVHDESTAYFWNFLDGMMYYLLVTTDQLLLPYIHCIIMNGFLVPCSLLMIKLMHH